MRPFACKDSNEGYYGGVACQGCQIDWLYAEMHSRLCNNCDKQFPEITLSSLLRGKAFIKGEVDPKSATGIVALGTAAPAITAVAAALVATASMVADLPAAGSATTAKAAAKKVAKAKDEAHVQKRQALVDNLNLYEVHRQNWLLEGQPTPMLLAKIAAGEKELAEHDKKHAKDNSVKDLVELTNTLYQLDNAAQDIENASSTVFSTWPTKLRPGNFSWKHWSMSAIKIRRKGRPQGQGAGRPPSPKTVWHGTPLPRVCGTKQACKSTRKRCEKSPSPTPPMVNGNSRKHSKNRPPATLGGYHLTPRVPCVSSNRR